MELEWCLCPIGLVACEGVGADAKLDSSGDIADARRVSEYDLSYKVPMKVGDLDVGGRGDGGI